MVVYTRFQSAETIQFCLNKMLFYFNRDPNPPGEIAMLLADLWSDPGELPGSPFNSIGLT